MDPLLVFRARFEVWIGYSQDTFYTSCGTPFRWNRTMEHPDSSFARQHAAAFGKPSLKQRLEEYYKMVSPDVIANKTEWRTRFEQIYHKYGGSLEKETKLANKLEKKYGVRLQVASHLAQQHPAAPSQRHTSIERQQDDEESFQLTDKERDSGICDVLSNAFDPVAALSNRSQTKHANETIWKESSFLDRVDQCASLLPPSDPLHRPKAPRMAPGIEDATVSKKRTHSYLERMAEQYNDRGPMRLLYQAAFGTKQRRKLRITTRYVNGIRGTVTGILVGFDKHMNLLMKDAKESYGPRLNDDPDQSNVERETARRSLLRTSDGFLRHRTMRHILVRGDTIVTCSFADEHSPSLSSTIAKQRGKS